MSALDRCDAADVAHLNRGLREGWAYLTALEYDYDWSSLTESEREALAIVHAGADPAGWTQRGLETRYRTAHAKVLATARLKRANVAYDDDAPVRAKWRTHSFVVRHLADGTPELETVALPPKEPEVIQVEDSIIDVEWEDAS